MKIFAFGVLLMFMPCLHAAELEGEHRDPMDAQLSLDHPGHDYHRHHLGIFVGGATLFEKDHSSETGMTIGLDYEYRFARNWGVGGVLEGVFFQENHRDLAFAVPFTWHPVHNLNLSAGPGFEADGHHTRFMIRASVSYGFHVGKFTLSPGVAADFVEDSQVLTYGVVFGRGF